MGPYPINFVVDEPYPVTLSQVTSFVNWPMLQCFVNYVLLQIIHALIKVRLVIKIFLKLTFWVQFLVYSGLESKAGLWTKAENPNVAPKSSTVRNESLTGEFLNQD